MHAEADSRRLRRDSARVGSAGTTALGSCLHRIQEEYDYRLWLMHSTDHAASVSAIQN